MYKPKSPAVDDAGELELRVDQQVIGADGSVPNVEPMEVILTYGGDVRVSLYPAHWPGAAYALRTTREHERTHDNDWRSALLSSDPTGLK